MKNADQIDDRIHALHQRGQRFGIVDIGFDRFDVREKEQSLAVVAMTRGYRDANVELVKTVGYPAADKTASADQEYISGFHGIPREKAQKRDFTAIPCPLPRLRFAPVQSRADS